MKFGYTCCDSYQHVCDKGPFQYATIIEYERITLCNPTTYTSLGEVDRDSNVANLYVSGVMSNLWVKSMMNRSDSTHAIKQTCGFGHPYDNDTPSEIFTYSFGLSCVEVCRNVFEGYNTKCGIATESNASIRSNIVLYIVIFCYHSLDIIANTFNNGIEYHNTA